MIRHLLNYKLILVTILVVSFVFSSCGKREAELSTEGKLSEFDSTLSISSTIDLDEIDELNSVEEDEDFEVMSIEINVSEFIAPTSEQIQSALKKAGYYKGDIDGKVGSKSKKAIVNFQIDNNLGADGVVGSKTWSKLKEYLDS